MIMKPHTKQLEEFWQENSNNYNIQYPDMFDPKWIVMESGVR